MEYSYSPSSSTGSPRPAASDEESCSYATVSSAPPKRRAGRTKFRETRHPIFKGVRRRGGAGRWVCEVREPNKKSRIWLGTFPTAEMAARAHDVAALSLRGRSACLNFADSAWRLAVPASASPRDIQLAAARAAEEFRPPQQAPLSEPDEAPTAMEPTSELSSLSSAVTAPAAAMVGIGEEFDAMEFGEGDYYSRMAEALLLDPPPAPGTAAGGGGCYWDDLDCARADVSLWSYSI